MIRVVVDRDPVAAGDDARPHGVVLELPDDARIGDAVLRLIDQRYLFMTSVTWIVSLVRDGEVRTVDDGLYIYDGVDVPVVALLSDDRDPPRWSALPMSSGWRSRSRFTETRMQLASGEYLLRCRYVSNGHLADLADYREHVTESDEAEAARWAAYRHRTWPQYYDERGERR